MAKKHEELPQPKPVGSRITTDEALTEPPPVEEPHPRQRRRKSLDRHPDRMIRQRDIVTK